MAARTRLATVEELEQKRTLKFTFVQEGIRREGFLIFHGGQVLAYENVCRHIPISLDYGDGRFLTDDERHIICQTHGAMYEPLTGLCIAGPCAGLSLKRVSIQIENGEIFSGEG